MLSVVSTWLGVLGARSSNRYDRKLIIRTVEAVILNPNGPSISVQQGEQRGSDAAHSRKREVGITDRRPRKNCVATAVRRRWMCHTRTVLPAGVAGRQFVDVVLSACCAHGCVHERAKNRPNITWYARMCTPVIFGFHLNLTNVK